MRWQKVLVSVRVDALLRPSRVAEETPHLLQYQSNVVACADCQYFKKIMNQKLVQGLV